MSQGNCTVQEVFAKTAEILFEAQEALMVAARSRWLGRPGNVVPLFRRP